MDQSLLERGEVFGDLTRDRGRGKAGAVMEGRVRRGEFGKREVRYCLNISYSSEVKSGIGEVPFKTRASSYL